MVAHSKIIEIEDFSSAKLKPYFERIAQVEATKFAVENVVIIPDSKNWETAMALYGFDFYFDNLKHKKIAGIGAGTELLTELLAERDAIVFPCDRYLEKTDWSDVAPQGYMVSSQPYNDIENIHRNIIPVNSDARCLEMPSDFFDAVYSSGSIEHFGGLDAIEAAASEIGRILKPGGIASISTEFRISGPVDKPWFDDNCILFTNDMLKKHIIEPAGLELLDFDASEQSSATFETRRDLIEFLSLAKQVTTIEEKKIAYPNLILEHEGFLFCSVHILAKKPMNQIKHKKQKTEFCEVVTSNMEHVAHNLGNIQSLEISSQQQSSENFNQPIDSLPISTIVLKKMRRYIERNPRVRRILLAILRRSSYFYTRIKRITEE